MDSSPVNGTVLMPSISCVQQGGGWFAEQQGGMERYYRDLLVELPKVCVECRGLVVGTDEVTRSTHNRVTAFAGTYDGLLRRWWCVRSANKSAESLHPTDLFVSHFACYAFPLLPQLRNRPMVVHFHGPWAAESQQEGFKKLNVWLKSIVESAVYRRADRIITLSAAFRDLLCQRYKIDPARVQVVPGGVNTAAFTDAAETSRATARNRLGWPTDRPIVLSVRRLMNRMGLENLIHAIREVRLTNPDVLCLIAGRGRLHETLQKEIESFGLQDHVRLLGFVPDNDLPFAYRAADFSIMPSVTLEGFGLSAVESLATGTPVLVTPVGGLPEVVAKLDSRLVLLTSQPTALADGISEAIRNPAMLPLSTACREYAIREFDWKHIALRIRNVYAEAI